MVSEHPKFDAFLARVHEASDGKIKTLADLARVLGIKSQNLYIQRKADNVRPQWLDTMARELNVDREWLAGEKDEPYPSWDDLEDITPTVPEHKAAMRRAKLDLSGLVMVDGEALFLAVARAYGRCFDLAGMERRAVLELMRERVARILDGADDPDLVQDLLAGALAMNGVSNTEAA